MAAAQHAHRLSSDALQANTDVQPEAKVATTSLRHNGSMAVYTELTHSDLQAFLSHYSVGSLVNFEGVAAGVENTNYRVEVSLEGHPKTLFLTLFEMHSKDEVPYFVDLITHLNQHHLPVATPIDDAKGHNLKQLKDKPAVLMSCIEGSHPDTPSEPQCHAVGHFLAQMHLAGRDFSLSKPNPRGHYWWDVSGHALAKKLNTFDANLMLDELSYLKEHWPKTTVLPYGVVHADLFTDNAFFKGDQLTGVIDFYNACDDFWLYDLAICINAWCQREDYLLDKPRLKAFLEGYQSVRQLTELEHSFWPTMLRAAAMRFWCSRLESLLEYQQNPISGLTPKNPDEMKHMLLDRQRHKYVI
jgi:homoserine kinase type II